MIHYLVDDPVNTLVLDRNETSKNIMVNSSYQRLCCNAACSIWPHLYSDMYVFEGLVYFISIVLLEHRIDRIWCTVDFRTNGTNQKLVEFAH